MPEVSIIITSYNYESYIKETIESVLNQDFNNWELIIVDDGSKDNSVDIIKEYCNKDKRIKLYQHENGINKGLSETLKLGISKSNSDWIAFVESDDKIHPKNLSKKFEIIHKYKNVDFIFNDLEMFGEKDVIDKHIIYLAMQKEALLKLNYPSNLSSAFAELNQNIIPTFSVVMLKKALLTNLDFNSPIKPALDYFLWMQLLKDTNFYYLNEKLTSWRMHSNSYINKKEEDYVQKLKWEFYICKYIFASKPFFFKIKKYIRLLRKCIISIRTQNHEIVLFCKAIKYDKISEKIFSIKKNTNGTKELQLCGIKINFKKKNQKEEYNCYTKILSNTTNEEKDIVMNSPFWDDLWYVNKYHHNFSRQEALNFWCSIGRFKGENPSKYINVKYCNEFCKGLNPIIAYRSKQFCFFPDNKNNFKDTSDESRINDYLKYKKTRKAKSVIYTCVTNDYDDLNEIDIYKYIDKDWDYVCFSDNKEMIQKGQVGIWTVLPLQYTESDNTRNNRWHKIFAHKLFKDYEESIYIDANINILSDYLFKIVKNTDKLFIQPRHFKNMCIYNEYKDVKNAHLDKEELINSELSLISKNKMPRNYGFGENNILYRKHNNTKIIQIMEEWWNMVLNYSKRDQLSLAYLLWKNNIDIKDSTFENSRFLINDFYVFGHKKER